MLYHVLSKFYLHWIDSLCLENQRIDLIQSKSTTARSWISSAGETAMSSNPWESHHMIVMKRKTPKKCILSKLQEFTLLYCPYSLRVPDLTCHKMQTSIENCLKQRARQGSSEVRAKQCMNLQHGLHFWLATFWDQRTCAFVPPFSLKRKDSNIKIGWPNKSSHLFCRSWWCQPFCTLAVVGNHSSVKVEILLWSWHHHIPTAARLQSVGRGHPYVLMKLQEIGNCHSFTWIYSWDRMGFLSNLSVHHVVWVLLHFYSLRKRFDYAAHAISANPSFDVIIDGDETIFSQCAKAAILPKASCNSSHTHRILTNTQNHYNFRNLFDPGPGNPV